VALQKWRAQRECTVTLSGILARDNDFIEGVSLAHGFSFPGWGLFLSASYSGASQKVSLSMPRRIKGEGRRLERNMPHPGHGESGIGFSPVRSVGDRHGKIR
jgi:hypothetical protein